MEALRAAAPESLDELLYRLRITWKCFAAECGLSERTLRRLRAGTHPLSARSLDALDTWLQAHGSSLSAVSLTPEAPLADHVTPLPRRPQPAAPAEPASPPEEPMETTAEYLDLAVLERLKLPADPFDSSENPEDIWMPPALRRIETMLLDAKRRRQIIAIVGETGAGKSTLLRRVHARQATDRNVRLIIPATLNRAQLNANALAVAILRDLIGKDTSSLATEPRSELLRSTLAEMGQSGVTPLLLIDEAHKLATAGLLAVKQVWDSHTMWRDLAVFMVGQVPLRERLRTEVPLKEVALRTHVVEIPKLTDAGDYLRWRFSKVHADADAVFDADAYKLLAARGGHLLRINNLAMKAMTYAVQHGEPRVTAACVGRV